MPTPGYVFRDGGPIPDSELDDNQRLEARAPGGANTQRDTLSQSFDSPVSNKDEKLSTLKGGATDSHALATAEHEVKGAAQEKHFETEVRDLGWDKDHKDVPSPLVGELPNEEIWMLLRRFNKHLYHVKSLKEQPLSGLDLEIADEDEFSPDKLRAGVERLYMTVMVGVIGLAKHVARLRSWREPVRTGAFLAVYALAWIFDFIVPLIFTTITVLILVPRTRTLMFPPIPLALIDSKTGGITSPRAGVLGSHDSVTGAPEKFKGEAVEMEAHNFVAGLGAIGLSSATGKHDDEDFNPDSPDASPTSPNITDPTKIATAMAEAKSFAQSGNADLTHDKTKAPMGEAMWVRMRPLMHTIGDIADGWERFGNALSPTRPFSRTIPRLRLASVVAPLIAISMVTSSYTFSKINWFFVGFGFFGNPLIWRGLDFLNQTYPRWQKLLEIRNSILKGVPTNAQLTITLLRIGEANKAPLPPPLAGDESPPNEAVELDKDEIPIDASHEEIDQAIHPDEEEQPESAAPKKSAGSRILGVLKGGTKVGVDTKLNVDSVKATVGSTHAKNHLGAVPGSKDKVLAGPVDFKARHKGTKGWVYINTSATIPCVSFSKHKSSGTGEQSTNSLDPVWSIPIDDIDGLKKIGGFGWKAKLVIGWATDKTVVDGLEIEDKKGNKTRITAIVQRNELFNRLVSMGGQKWESW